MHAGSPSRSRPVFSAASRASVTPGGAERSFMAAWGAAWGWLGVASAFSALGTVNCYAVRPTLPTARARRHPPMNLHRLLEARAAQGKPVRAVLIGAGKFGSMYLSQARRTPGLQILAVADLAPDR